MVGVCETLRLGFGQKNGSISTGGVTWCRIWSKGGSSGEISGGKLEGEELGEYGTKVCSPSKMAGGNVDSKLKGYPLGEKYIFGSECGTNVCTSVGRSDGKVSSYVGSSYGGVRSGGSSDGSSDGKVSSYVEILYGKVGSVGSSGG